MKKPMKQTKDEIGKAVAHEFGGLLVQVEILDVKFAYGRRRWLVRPRGEAMTASQVWIYAQEKPKFLD